MRLYERARRVISRRKKRPTPRDAFFPSLLRILLCKTNCRYSRQADWSYIERVAVSQDDSVRALPIIGNGDILSHLDYEAKRAAAPSTEPCAMLARGALIKPWLPTEIKESRTWDISSSERLDIIKTFVRYGLEHWGSDDCGRARVRPQLRSLVWDIPTHQESCLQIPRARELFETLFVVCVNLARARRPLLARVALLPPPLHARRHARAAPAAHERPAARLRRPYAEPPDRAGVSQSHPLVFQNAFSFRQRQPHALLEISPTHSRQRDIARPLLLESHERRSALDAGNDLETLMASSNANDWLKITELVLGPTPDSFKFEPKHKANSFAAETTSKKPSDWG